MNNRKPKLDLVTLIAPRLEFLLPRGMDRSLPFFGV